MVKTTKEKAYNARELYYFIAEKVGNKRKSNYESVNTCEGINWGFLTYSPVPKWYKTAKDVLLKAIELAPEQESFGLFINLKQKEIYVFPQKNNRAEEAEMSRCVDKFLKEKRAEDKRQARGKYSLSIGDILEGLTTGLDNPSKLLNHPYFQALTERRWHGVTSYARPGKVAFGLRLQK